MTITTQSETPPDRRDADAQAIADRMAPFVAAEGFAREWALSGRAIVEAHVDAAFEALLAVLSEPAPEHVTFRYDLATGESSLTEAPGQEEHRVILDGSNEQDRLTTYRSICRLFNYFEQRMLGLASEVLIVDALDEWIAKNEPHPHGPCDGLQVVIVLPLPGFPPFGDSNHHEDCRQAAHTAVLLARCATGRSTHLLISNGSSEFGNSDGLAEFLASSPPETAFGVKLTAKSFMENWLPGTKVENTMVLIDAGGHVRDYPKGVDSISLVTSGESVAYWRGVLGELHQSAGRRRTAQIVQCTAFRLVNGRSAKQKWLL